MIKVTKLILIASVLAGTALSALADRGIGRKSKNKVSLNITVPSTLRNSISFNLKSGLTYTGSLLSKKQVVNGVFVNNTLITYQKGNTVYIVPYKQKILVPDMSQGYTGTKLIIRPH